MHRRRSAGDKSSDFLHERGRMQKGEGMTQPGKPRALLASSVVTSQLPCQLNLLIAGK